jgi:hypothetical protein
LWRILPRSILYKPARTNIEPGIWQTAGALRLPTMNATQRAARDALQCHRDAFSAHHCLGGVKGVNRKSHAKMSLPNMKISAFEDCPPDGPKLTSYDERHLATYLRLLDANEEGADWKEAVRIIFDLDPDREPERARMVYDSHLARARWMTRSGFRHLLRPRPH